ncbi:MAG: phosphotransferase [Anaerolineaceae bacterium]|nr:phosphotransferase [Anaerolineaceae bacterium]
MKRHPYFDLLQHENHELEQILQGEIQTRQTLQEWPLSAVEKITLDDGRKFTCKAQRPPTLELAFYQQTHAPHLMNDVFHFQQGDYQTILFEWVEAAELDPYMEEHHQILWNVDRFLKAIEQMDHGQPVFIDLSTAEKFTTHFTQSSRRIRELVQQQQLSEFILDWIESFDSLVSDPAMVSAAAKNARLVHGDLTADNVLLTPEQDFYILDWQRPLRCNPELDRMLLLNMFEKPPDLPIDEHIQYLYQMLQIDWLAQCADRWFPAGIHDYDYAIRQNLTILFCSVNGFIYE